MKVEQEKKFTPIVITLETYEEACNLWHKLSISEDHVKEYYDGERYEGWYNEEVDTEMYLSLQDIFTPKKKY